MNRLCPTHNIEAEWGDFRLLKTIELVKPVGLVCVTGATWGFFFFYCLRNMQRAKYFMTFRNIPSMIDDLSQREFSFSLLLKSWNRDKEEDSFFLVKVRSRVTHSVIPSISWGCNWAVTSTPACTCSILPLWVITMTSPGNGMQWCDTDPLMPSLPYLPPYRPLWQMWILTSL